MKVKIKDSTLYPTPGRKEAGPFRGGEEGQVYFVGNQLFHVRRKRGERGTHPILFVFDPHLGLLREALSKMGCVPNSP